MFQLKIAIFLLQNILECDGLAGAVMSARSVLPDSTVYLCIYAAVEIHSQFLLLSLHEFVLSLFRKMLNL